MHARRRYGHLREVCTRYVPRVPRDITTPGSQYLPHHPSLIISTVAVACKRVTIGVALATYLR